MPGGHQPATDRESATPFAAVLLLILILSDVARRFGTGTAAYDRPRSGRQTAHRIDRPKRRKTGSQIHMCVGGANLRIA
jgi:hypothetical protein